MNRQIDELFRSVSDLREWVRHDERHDPVQVYHRLNEMVTRAMRDLFPTIRWEYREPYGDGGSIHRHLLHLERRIEQLMQADRTCRMNRDDGLRFPQMLTAMADIQANLQGNQKFQLAFSEWFTDARAVVIDPYIFSNGGEGHNQYCDGIVKILETNPDRIDFFFSADPKAYKASVADKIFNDLNNIKIRDMNFYACTNLHDRVWMKHFDTTDSPPKKFWEGRVVGASANGVAARPTYIIDMPKEDAIGYSSYLAKVRVATGTQHTLTPPP